MSIAPQFLAVSDGRWGKRQIIKFGGLPNALTGVVQTYQDLNDGVHWFASDIQVDGNHISNKSSQLTWRGKGIWKSQDFVGRKITIPAQFDEAGGIPYAAVKGVLTGAGEQYLTFDDLTGIRCRLNSFAIASPQNPDPPYLWNAPLEFLARNPFAEDLSGPIILGPYTIPTGSSPTLDLDGADAIVYDGHIYGEPVFVFSFPAGSQNVGQLRINNASYPDQLIATTTPFAVAAGVTATVSSELFAAWVGAYSTGQLAPSGTFPFLYSGPNHLRISYIADASIAGATVSIKFARKWEI